MASHEQASSTSAINTGDSNFNQNNRNTSSNDMTSFLGGPAYTPEQGFLLAVGGLYSFKTSPAQSQLQRSSVSAFVTSNYVNGAISYGAQVRHNLYWDNNKLMLAGQLNIGVDQSKHYWGIGEQAAKEVELGDDTLYRSNSINYEGRLFKQFENNWYVGPLVSLNYFDVTSPPSTGFEDDNFLTYQNVRFTFGIGAAIKYDTRDIEVNARDGSLFQAEFLTFNDKLLSELSYHKFNLDFRTYHDFDNGNVLALLANYQQSFGDTPYFDMPEIGGAFSMRGLYQGRYRDEIATEITTEYRYTFKENSTGKLSRHGVTFWTGLASVSDQAKDIYSNLIGTMGIGYRYELQPRMNLRLDLGFSKHGSGFYFNFTEAF
ncbi:BamA/TamA family outer membrane protein [Vibrio paucivorans]|uniref:BamA/TamA family outer membrane protein n=1 Tax=Vibrio paucivorans TaxID=2829489 RepID=A0A9X3CEW0_9VIBR|nr:BamA/TamA family outer membrane protein [Vibrio paucivorans]MCW8334441.1 BamA/TamA family outer membrane protein [Vibrio paucivorans]